VLCVSEAVREVVGGSDTEVLYNGIDARDFHPSRDAMALRDSLGIERDAPVVGMLARLRPWKGQESFLSIAAAILAEAPETRFLIAGGTPFDVKDEFPARLRSMSASLGIEHALVFAGQVEDVEEALAAMDVLVQPGRPEPFGLATLEAMAMERPIVGFRHGALPELLTDECGILVTPYDEPAVSRATIELLRDPDRRRLLGRAARLRAKESFSLERVAGEFAGILEHEVRRPG
jgi:glycosyltransferase involved in cell wall biosynthesis